MFLASPVQPHKSSNSSSDDDSDDPQQFCYDYYAMKSLIFSICLVVVAGSNPLRRFRKVYTVPDDKDAAAVSPLNKHDESVEDVFERLLHSEWDSFSYNYNYNRDHHHHSGSHSHSSSHSHDHRHSHRHDDHSNNNPYTTDDYFDFTQAGSSTDDATGGDDQIFTTATQEPTQGGTTLLTDDFTSPSRTDDFTAPPSPAVTGTTEDHSSSGQLVSANEAGNEPTEEPTSSTSSCSFFEACSAFAGDCCPNAEGVFKPCCFGIAYPPLTIPPTESPSTTSGTNDPTASWSWTENSVWPASEWPASSNPTTAPPVSTEGPTTPLVVALENQRQSVIEEKCGVPEGERSSQLMSALPAMEIGSPQYQAFQWLNNIDGGVLCGTEESLSQRFGLAATYFSLHGVDWKNCSATEGQCNTAARWMSESSECDWFGVACDMNHEVTVLTLKDNGLSGDLPMELFSLTKLTGLSLDHNKNITGMIPEELGALTMLEYIELDDNDMTGPLPSSLYSLTTLKALDLNGNQFNGTIDDSISNLSDLMVLQVEDNAFEGPVPWFGLAMLKDLRK